MKILAATAVVAVVVLGATFAFKDGSNVKGSIFSRALTKSAVTSSNLKMKTVAEDMPIATQPVSDPTHTSEVELVPGDMSNEGVFEICTYESKNLYPAMSFDDLYSFIETNQKLSSAKNCSLQFSFGPPSSRSFVFNDLPNAALWAGQGKFVGFNLTIENQSLVTFLMEDSAIFRTTFFDGSMVGKVVTNIKGDDFNSVKVDIVKK